MPIWICARANQSRDSCTLIIYSSCKYNGNEFHSWIIIFRLCPFWYIQKIQNSNGSNTRSISNVRPFWRPIQRTRGSNKFFIQTNYTMWRRRSIFVLQRKKKKKKIPRTGAPVYLRNVHITFFLVIHSGYNSYSRARISRKKETCTEGATSKLAFRSDSSESSLLRDIIITREACIF